MKKKILTIIILCLLIVIAIICNINYKNNPKKSSDDSKITDNIKFKKEYESLNSKINENNQKKYVQVNIPKDNVIKYSNIDEILEILDSKTGIVYFGFPECPWCRNAIPVLLNAAVATGVGQIYYLNMSDVRDVLKLDAKDNVITEKKGKKGYSKLLEKMDSILDEYILENEDGKKISTNEKRIYVPLVIFIKDGKIVSYHTDTVESQEDPYTPLSAEQTEELYNIYTDGIIKMQDSACDESC